MGRPAASWKGVSAEVGQTGRMRIYLPATAAHLRASVLGSSHQPLTAHAATPALAQALPEEDEEGLEVSASLCAADASVVLLAEPEAAGLADRRIVIAADVEAENVRELPVEGDVLPGTIEVTGEITCSGTSPRRRTMYEPPDSVRRAPSSAPPRPTCSGTTSRSGRHWPRVSASDWAGSAGQCGARTRPTSDCPLPPNPGRPGDAFVQHSR